MHANTCSGVDQDALAFSKIFAGIPGQTVGGDTRVDVPDPVSAVDNPKTSPYPIWRLTAQYPGGYKVVWHGLVYAAKWSNSGVDPNAPTQAGTPNAWSVVGPVIPTEKPLKPVLQTSTVKVLWSPSPTYNRGNRVLFNGLPYEARWTTKADPPSTDYPVAPDDPWLPLFDLPDEPPTS